MRDPFVKAAQRIVKRLGQPVSVINANGETLEIKGVYSNPEGDQLVKGKTGGLTFKQRQATLTVLTQDVPDLSNDWQFTINGTEYFAADHEDDSHGCTKIFLAKDIEEVEEDNGKWR